MAAMTFARNKKRMFSMLDDLSAHLEKFIPNDAQLQLSKQMIQEVKTVVCEYPETGAGENPIRDTVSSIDEDVDRIIDLQQIIKQHEEKLESHQLEIEQLQKDVEERNSLIEKLQYDIEIPQTTAK